jgi:hypothetical protein
MVNWKKSNCTSAFCSGIAFGFEQRARPKINSSLKIQVSAHSLAF